MTDIEDTLKTEVGLIPTNVISGRVIRRIFEDYIRGKHLTEEDKEFQPDLTVVETLLKAGGGKNYRRCYQCDSHYIPSNLLIAIGLNNIELVKLLIKYEITDLCQNYGRAYINNISREMWNILIEHKIFYPQLEMVNNNDDLEKLKLIFEINGKCALVNYKKKDLTRHLYKISNQSNTCQLIKCMINHEVEIRDDLQSNNLLANVIDSYCCEDDEVDEIEPISIVNFLLEQEVNPAKHECRSLKYALKRDYPTVAKILLRDHRVYNYLPMVKIAKKYMKQLNDILEELKTEPMPMEIN